MLAATYTAQLHTFNLTVCLDRLGRVCDLCRFAGSGFCGMETKRKKIECLLTPEVHKHCLARWRSVFQLNHVRVHTPNDKLRRFSPTPLDRY